MDKRQCNRKSEKNIQYVRKEDLIALKQKLFEKVGRDILNKYGNLLNDKNLTIEYFENLFNNEIEKFYDYNQPNYAKFLQQVESTVLKKINKVDDKKRVSLLQKNETEKLTSDDQNVLQPNKNILNSTTEDRNKRDKLRNELRTKQEDDWAKIITNDYKAYLSEENNKSMKKFESKKEYKKDLDNLLNNKKSQQSNFNDNDSHPMIEYKSEDEKAEKILKNKITLETIQKENFKNKDLIKFKLEKQKEEDRVAENFIRMKIEEENLKINQLNEKKRTQEQQVQNYLKEQMEIKRDKKILLQNQKMEERKVISSLINQDLNKKQKEVETKISSKIKYRDELTKQIGSKQNQPLMNHVERMINKKLLKI